MNISPNILGIIAIVIVAVISLCLISSLMTANRKTVTTVTVPRQAPTRDQIVIAATPVMPTPVTPTVVTPVQTQETIPVSVPVFVEGEQQLVNGIPIQFRDAQGNLITINQAPNNITATTLEEQGIITQRIIQPPIMETVLAPRQEFVPRAFMEAESEFMPLR